MPASTSARSYSCAFWCLSSSSLLLLSMRVHPIRRGCDSNVGALHQYAFHDVPMHVGEAVVAALVFIGELRVIDAKQVEDRGLQVVDVDGAGGELVLGW